ncbi:MAG: zinc-dependent metalloprotease [Euzebyales bacterium]|jgi:coenzyme F420 biosynthesis associated uncharacterized protein|nr:zinc-dependent metalloprotease [Euzebyales bacterium]
MTAGSIADWALAERVAGLVATASPPQVERAEADALRADLHAAVASADRVARAATGLGAELAPASCHVIGRRTWIRSNAASIAWLTDPLADRLLRAAGVQRAVARAALGVQLGIVLGYLSTRVLGQYEVIRPDDRTPGRLLLVGPNLLHTERELLAEEDLTASEFRYGIVLHELAHRLQFEAVPWLRPHLRGLLDTYFAEARFDADRMKEVAARVPELLRDPSRLTDPRRLAEIVLTPGQTAVLDQAQAMMSLLEGHGNVVMDWGADLNDGQRPTFDPTKVRTVLNRRRSRAGEQALRTALGLSMKAEQYAVGERFILAVAQSHGRAAFNRVWDNSENLPTASELDEPDAWAQRVAG